MTLTTQTGNIATHPVHAPQWTSGLSQSLGDYIAVQIPNTNPAEARFYECTTAGTSGGTEPNWSTAIGNGDTINDGSVEWTCRHVSKLPGRFRYAEQGEVAQ